MRNIPSILFAAALGFGCSASPGTQVVTGTVSTSDAIAVRAITAGVVVTAAQVRSDGTFTLALPADASYRLELLTASGVRPLLADSGTAYRSLEFKVCQPTGPVDIGHVGGHHHHGGGGGPSCDPATDANCQPPPPSCDPSDPNCPPPCPDPDASGNCPPKCDPSTDPSCVPPPCTDPTGANCGPGCPNPDASGNCPPPPKCDPAEADPGASCPPPPPPPCTDPTDANTCQDPCMGDPANCACPSTAPDCWPQPEPPKCDAAGNCTPPGGGDGMCPDHPPGDIGCGDAGTTVPSPTGA